MEDNVGKKITFTAINAEGQQITYNSVIHSVQTVRNSQGVEQRYRVPLTLIHRGQRKKIDVNLRDRSSMIINSSSAAIGWAMITSLMSVKNRTRSYSMPFGCILTCRRRDHRSKSINLASDVTIANSRISARLGSDLTLSFIQILHTAQ